MSDNELQLQFEGQTLPFGMWNHRRHVRIDYIYATTLAYAEALEKLRAGIKAYNKKNEVPE